MQSDPAMAKYQDVLAALPDFRNDLLQRRMREAAEPAAARAFAARGAFAAYVTATSNIHATGIGIRYSGGKYHPDEFVLKVFVFDTVDAEAQAVPPAKDFNGMPVDVEALPVQVIRARRPSKATAASATPAGQFPQRERQKNVAGGVSISPFGVNYVGTLGCFVKTSSGAQDERFVLSNDHVLANVDALPVGTGIVQPGPEQEATLEKDLFASLSSAIPIQFPSSTVLAPRNNFDAALAVVTDRKRITSGALFGGIKYDPSKILAPVPGMRVMKMGRTTGESHGTITAAKANGVQVNYGIPGAPRIAVYDDTITIVGDAGRAFSLPGDSGSIIVEEASGHPVALLFAGDGRTTTACNFGALCERLHIWPV